MKPLHIWRAFYWSAEVAFVIWWGVAHHSLWQAYVCLAVTELTMNLAAVLFALIVAAAE